MSKERNTLRLYPNLIRAVVEALRTVFAEDKYADAVVRNLLKSNPKWGSNDRKFLAETTYEVVRWWRKLWSIYGKEVSLKDAALWDLLGIYFMLSGYDSPPWKEFERIRNIDVNQALSVAEKQRVIRESIPDWLDKIGVSELGNKWEEEIHCLNEQAPVIIRVNTLKTSLPDLRRILKEEDVQTELVPNHPEALRLNVRKNIFTTQSFREGLFEVQDASSQLVAHFIDVKDGMRVIDACAGGGGKTLHMAALMHNKGKIIALDVHEWKLKELQRRAARAGISIVETRVLDSSKVIKRLEKSADRLLLDVPCSGLGVLRRNPDIKWKLSPEAIDRIKQQQYQIISSYCSMLKVAGKMVYATCSILPSENEGIVDAFVKENLSFKKLAEKKILPSQDGSDGFYMALIERAGE